MNDDDAVKNIINKIKEHRKSWQMSPRRKNSLFLGELGLDSESVLDEIYQQLTWDCYIKGPVPDNHPHPIPGDIWIFGLQINDRECYLKFQDKPSGIIMWISIHAPEHPLLYKYR